VKFEPVAGARSASPVTGAGGELRSPSTSLSFDFAQDELIS